MVRPSGTFISSTVSLGYDVPREKVEKCLLEAAEHADLIDPFVFVMALGDFSITYQAAGFLKDVKYLISAESALRESMLDSLHRAGIEIVSPTFMNQRQLDQERVFIPRPSLARKDVTSSPGDSRPEELMFDKAEKAESEAKVEHQLEAVVDEIDKLKKTPSDEEGKDRGKARIEELKQKKTELEDRMREQAERKGSRIERRKEELVSERRGRKPTTRKKIRTLAELERDPDHELVVVLLDRRGPSGLAEALDPRFAGTGRRYPDRARS